MTKYILNSGGVGGYPEKAKKYYDETLKELGGNPKILFCFMPRKEKIGKLNLKNIRKTLSTIVATMI